MVITLNGWKDEANMKIYLLYKALTSDLMESSVFLSRHNETIQPLKPVPLFNQIMADLYFNYIDPTFAPSPSMYSANNSIHLRLEISN